MTKTLRVDLADLEGIPHASGPSGTSVVVTAEYTSPVILASDGTIILAPKSKTMGTAGRVDFDGIYASDSEDVREDHRGFAVRVKVAIREPNGATRTWSRTVKPLEHMASTIRLGQMPSAQGLPPQWVSVDDFVNAVDAQLGVAVGNATAALEAAESAESAAQSAESAAQSASLSASNSATLAAQAQAAALEVPDANVSALIGNDATDTAQAGDGRWLKGTRDANNTIRALTNTNDNSAGVGQCIFIAAPSSTSPHTINGSTALLRLVLGGYDSTMEDALAATMIQGMHASIDAGSTHGLILGGSYQHLIDADYSAAIAGTGNTIGGDTPSNYSVSLGGLNNTVQGYHSIAAAGTLNNIRARAAAVSGQSNATYGDYTLLAGRENTVGDVSAATWGQYAAVAGGYQNKVGTTASAQYSATVGGRAHEMQVEYAGAVGGYGVRPRFGGAQAWAMGFHTAPGDSQMERAVLRGTSATTGTKQLLVNDSIPLIMPDNTTWAFDATLMGRRASDGATGAWKIKGVCARGAGAATVALIGEPSIEMVGATAGDAEAWSITVAMNPTNGSLMLRGRSPSGGTVNWVCGCDLTEVTA